MINAKISPKMSFRIEDILKTEKAKTEVPHSARINKIELIKSLDCSVYPSNDSILQQTLLSKNRYAYYRSISEPYSRNYLNSDWMYPERFHLLNCCENYSRKASCSTIYPRSQFWGGYSSYPMLWVPQYSKRKGGQVRFTATQTDVLEKRFVSHKYLSPEDRRILADSLKLTDRQVKTWFQNRRAKWRRSNSSSDTLSDKLADSESEQECCDIKKSASC